MTYSRTTTHEHTNIKTIQLLNTGCVLNSMTLQGFMNPDNISL